MENITLCTKTIRVSYCDPDATDSSSDEESDKSQKQSKRKFSEIEVEFVGKNQNEGTKGFKKPNLMSEGEKMVGIRKMKGGKFWVEIKDPIKKRWVWLGIFGTAEAAYRAYLAEESKIAAAELRAKQPVPKTAGKKIVGVRMRKWGKFGAEIRNPITKRREWLGTFDTEEEASRVYLAKKAHFAAEKLSLEPRIDRVASSKFQDSVSSILNNDTPELTSFPERARTRICGVWRRNGGKFSAEIRNPVTKRRVWIGTFATEEEASRAYLAKEAKFEDQLRAKQGFGRVASSKFQDSVSSILNNDTPELTSFPEGARTRICGVRRRNGGKFSAEIRNPVTKRRVWIGTFATEEEASRAYLAKEAKFEDQLRAKQGFGRVASKKSLAPDSVSSVLEIETSSLSNETVGENKVSMDEEAEFGFIDGVQVVDKNGFLVGKFGMLDDLSICSVDEDANS